MPKSQLIHVKLDYTEAVQAKKHVLSSQIETLRVLNHLKRYHALRTEELKTKLKLHRKIKELLTHMKKLQITLPKIKVPEVLKHEDQHQEKPKDKKQIKQITRIIIPKPKDKTIDSELADIQRRLRELGE